MEGDENDAFWDTLGDEEDYMSYIEGTFFCLFLNWDFPEEKNGKPPF